MTPRDWSTCELPVRAAICDPLQGGGSIRKRTPRARTGLETAPLVVNAGSGCSAAVNPRLITLG